MLAQALMNEIPLPDWPGPDDSAASADAARAGGLCGLFVVGPLFLFLLWVASTFWEWPQVLLRSWYVILCAAPFMMTWLLTRFRKNWGQEAQQALWEEHKQLIPRIRAGEKDFAGADLLRANFSEADLRGAQLDQEQLAKVRSYSGAIMPDGSRRP